MHGSRGQPRREVKMSADRHWYLWPQGYYNKNFVPWFVILRRLMFFPLLLTGKSLTFLAIVGGFGAKEALVEWKK